jgi:uncharacterized protein with GYD domain
LPQACAHPAIPGKSSQSQEEPLRAAAATADREARMPTYIALANWTDQGARQVKESPHRVELARKTLKEMGGEFRSLYMTMGDYDLVFVYEAPDDAVAARFTLVLGQLGTVRTRTLKAFPEAAYREIINSLR